MNECIFCNTKENILVENSSAYTVLNYTPACPGHFLAVPKKHVLNIADLKDDISGLFEIIDSTLEKITALITSKNDFLVNFYSGLLENPPFVYSEQYSIENTEYLRIVMDQCKDIAPPIGYNVGYNMNSAAGRREEHFHCHVFPRYKEGLGVVNAMRRLLS